MIGIVLRIFFLMQGGNRVRHKIHIHDVDLVVCDETAAPAVPPETRTPSPCRTAWSPDSGCRPARCWDGKSSSGTSGKKLPHHVLAELLGARIGIVIRTVPINRLVFGHHLVAALARHRHRAHMAEAPQPVIVVRLPAPAARLPACRAGSRSGSFFPICGSATPRSESPNRWCGSAGRSRHPSRPNAGRGQVAAKNPDPRLQIFVEARKIQVQLQGACHRRASASCGSRRPHQQVQRSAVLPSSRLAATCAPMYPVEPVRNIATLLRLYRS